MAERPAERPAGEKCHGSESTPLWGVARHHVPPGTCLLAGALHRKGYTPQYKGSRCMFVRAARTGFLSSPDSQGSVLGQHRRVLVVFGVRCRRRAGTGCPAIYLSCRVAKVLTHRLPPVKILGCQGGSTAAALASLRTQNKTAPAEFTRPIAIS